VHRLSMWISYSCCKMISARFTYYTPCTYADTHSYTHTKVISMKLYSLRPRLSWMIMKYSLHAFMSMQSFCIYHIYLRRRILFLIYQFQFLSLCHSREDEDIPKNSGRCHSSRPSLTSLIPSSSHTPLVNRCKHKMQVALFFKTSFRRPGHSSPMERNSSFSWSIKVVWTKQQY